MWEEQCDLFIAVITDTDRLQHFEWNSIEDKNAKNHQRAMEFYSKVDELVGKIITRLESNDEIMMMSDHGFTGIEDEVYLNKILADNGFLKWEENPPANFAKIDSSSKAFVLDPSRIYIHKKGKYPKGAVEEKEVDKIKNELKDLFLGLKTGGKSVIKSVFSKEEIYQGELFDLAPDLVLISNYHFDLKGNIKSQKAFDKTHFTGMHTRDDAFLITDQNFDNKKPHIEDLSDVILKKVNG